MGHAVKQSRDSLRQGYDRDYKSEEPPHLEPLFVGDWGPLPPHDRKEGQMTDINADLLEALRDLRDRAAMVVNRSDFGAVTEARIWAALYQSIQHATAVIDKAEGTP